MALTGTGVTKFVAGSAAGAGILSLAIPGGEVPEAVASKLPSPEAALGLVFLALAGLLISMIVDAKKKREASMEPVQVVSTNPPKQEGSGHGSGEDFGTAMLFRQLDNIAKGIERNQDSIGELTGEFKGFKGAIEARVNRLESDNDDNKGSIANLERKVKNTGEIPRP